MRRLPKKPAACLLRRNDLFSFRDFEAQKDFLLSLDEALYESIVREYAHVFQKVRIFENKPRYAVQGDISNCNLYQTADGRIGVFDFNRCGDNILYYDAVMQAIFEAWITQRKLPENKKAFSYPHF